MPVGWFGQASDVSLHQRDGLVEPFLIRGGRHRPFELRDFGFKPPPLGLCFTKANLERSAFVREIGIDQQIQCGFFSGLELSGLTLEPFEPLRFVASKGTLMLREGSAQERGVRERLVDHAPDSLIEPGGRHRVTARTAAEVEWVATGTSIQIDGRLAPSALAPHSSPA
jgi:hypothetical protein